MGTLQERSEKEERRHEAEELGAKELAKSRLRADNRQETVPHQANT